MLDSFALSLYFLLFLLASLALTRQAALPRFETGRKLVITKKAATGAIIAAVIIFATFAWLVTNNADASTLQIFYCGFFGLSLLLCPLVLFRNRRQRLIGAATALIILTATFIWPCQWLQNIIMGLAILWIAPLIIKKLWLHNNYLLIALITLGLIDIYNVCLSAAAAPFSDESLILNGMFRFGGFALGIGDFIVAAVAVLWLQRLGGRGFALAVAALIAFARLIIRLAFPEMGDIPYLAIIALIAAVGCFGLMLQNKHNKRAAI